MQVTDLTGRATGSQQARLQWTDPAGATGFQIWQNIVDVFGTATALNPNPAIGDEVYNVHGLTPVTDYYFWIVPTGGTESASVKVTTDAAPVRQPDERALRKALVDWAKAGSRLEVIWLDQNGPRPPKPYVGLNIFGPRKEASTDYPTDKGEAISGMRAYTVSVHAYVNPPEFDTTHPDASQILGDLTNFLEHPDALDALNEAGIGVGEVNSVQDVSSALETKFERHFNFDFEIHVASKMPIQVQTVETVEFPSI